MNDDPQPSAAAHPLVAGLVDYLLEHVDDIARLGFGQVVMEIADGQLRGGHMVKHWPRVAGRRGAKPR